MFSAAAQSAVSQQVMSRVPIVTCSIISRAEPSWLEG